MLKCPDCNSVFSGKSCPACGCPAEYASVYSPPPVASAPAFSSRTSGHEGQRTLPAKRSMGIGHVLIATLGLLLLFLTFGALTPLFTDVRNIQGICWGVAPIILMGISQAHVLITRNIDLSIGSMVVVSCAMADILRNEGIHPAGVCFIALAACLIIGLLNGIVVAKCKIPSPIATLCTSSIVYRIMATGNWYVTSDSRKHYFEPFDGLLYLIGPYFRPYLPLFITLVLWLLFFILGWMWTGRHVHVAAERDSKADRSSGMSAGMVVFVYLVSAFCACAAGLAMANRGVPIVANNVYIMGNTWIFCSVAAALIGGLSAFGGRGFLLGTIIGAAIVSVLSNGFNIMNIPLSLPDTLIAVIVMASALVSMRIWRGTMLSENRSDKNENVWRHSDR